MAALALNVVNVSLSGLKYNGSEIRGWFYPWLLDILEPNLKRKSYPINKVYYDMLFSLTMFALRIIDKDQLLLPCFDSIKSE